MNNSANTQALRQVSRRKFLKTTAAAGASALAFPSIVSAGVVGNGAAGPLVEQANAKYEQGMKLFRGFRQGTNANNNKLLKEALVLLDQAIDLYDQAQQKDPNNKAIADRATEASMSAYSCRKYQTL